MTASLQGRAATTVRTMGRVMFVDPVRAGRLRVAGLTPLTRGLAILGVGTLGMLLVSLILNDLWRRGPLALVRDFEATPNLAAKGVVSFTVVALAIAWVLILVGGALARPPVAVVAAVAFLLGNTSMSEVLTRGDSTALRMLPDVVAACYFAAPALLVALSCLRLTERWRGVRPVLGVALAAAGIAFFAAHLAIFVLEERAGNPSILPRQLDGAMNGLQGFLVPLFVLAVAALVQLNHQVTRAVTTPFWTLSTRVAKLAVLLLVAVKLRYALDGRVDEWTAYVVERRPQAVQAAGFVLLLALAALLFRRLGEERPPEVPTDGVVFAGSALLATTVVVTGIILSGATFLARVGPGEPDRWVLEHFPFRFMGKYLTLTVFAVVFIIGLSLVVRPRPPPRGRHLGAVLVLLGAWIIPSLVLQQLSDRDVGFNIGLVDLALTLAALVYL
ncbi:MAG: hypothetical protein QOE93_1673, partial [Actinomycetota bacterium]|nr:hypothetical protein [Actinomycetota bacterium]